MLGRSEFALRQDFAGAKCLYGAKAPVLLSAEHFTCLAPLGAFFCFMRRRRLNPRVIQMLGGSESHLRQDFAAQNACTAQMRRFWYPWDI